MSDPVFVYYKSLQLLSPTPTGAGGQILNSNFTSIADFIDATNATLATKANASSLSAYATTTSVTNLLTSYLTASQTNTAISSAIAAIPVVNLSGYVTSSSLTTTLGGYSTTGVTSSAISSAISALSLGTASTHAASDFQAAGSYVTTTGLTSTLSNYATTSSLGGYVPIGRTVSTTGPLSGGGSLSGNLTLSISAASGTAAGSMSATHYALLNAANILGTPNTIQKLDASGILTAAGMTITSGNGITLYDSDESYAPAQIYTSDGQLYLTSDQGLGKNINVGGYWFRPSGLSFSTGWGSGYMIDIEWGPYQPTGTNGSAGVYNGVATLTNADGVNYGLRLVNSYSTSGTASGVDIFVNRPTNTTGSGAQYLLQLQSLSSNKFTVAPSGNTTIAGTLSAGASTVKNSSSSIPTLTIEQDNASGFTFNINGANTNNTWGGELDDNYQIVAFAPTLVNGESDLEGSGQSQFIPVFGIDCFPAGTPVLTPDGYVAIETLKIGDNVISMDEPSHIAFTNVVIDTLKHKPRQDGGLLLINETMRVTRRHKMLVNDVYMPIGKAKIGDYLINSDGHKVWIFSIEETGETCETYNIKVEGPAKNYFAHDLLVHNKCPFLYVFDKGKWIYQNTFIYELDAPEKSAVQRRKLRTLTNEFVIRELEPETSYIKDMALIAISPAGETKLKWLNKSDNLVTNQGDYVQVKFEQLPEGTTELWVEAEGYYIWHE